MKTICVSMSLKENVLDSYLLRVFGGFMVEKKTCKVVYFPEGILSQKSPWTVKRFKNFCNAVVETKTGLRMYKANLKKGAEGGGVGVNE